MRRDLLALLKEGRRREGALDQACASISAGLLRLNHDLQRVEAVFGRDNRFRALLNRLDQVAQAVSPGPVRVGLGEDLPRADAVLPQLIALGIPVISEHL